MIKVNYYSTTCHISYCSHYAVYVYLQAWHWVYILFFEDEQRNLISFCLFVSYVRKDYYTGLHRYMPDHRLSEVVRVLHRADLAKPLQKQLGLRSVPVEERVLLKRLVKLLELKFAPARCRRTSRFDGLLAAVVVFFAQRSKPGLEEEMVNEIREMALAELQTDADEIKDQFDRIGARVMEIEEAVSALRGIGHGSTLSSLGPVVDLAVHALKSRHGGK